MVKCHIRVKHNVNLNVFGILFDPSSAPRRHRMSTTSTFSFTAPFPASAAASATAKRRVSLALPSSPRLVPAWSFRDDTSLASHVAETSTSGLKPTKRGKMRKIALDDDDPSDDITQGDGAHTQEKKARKKWTLEETQVLVDGCNKVRSFLHFL
jgi:hypothetical protein